MRKKAILGGTFDPIHNGHLHIAYEALQELKLDTVVFMPSGNPPHKTSKHITDASIRYELVKMAVRNESRFEISDYEIKNEGLSYTYKTLEYLNETEPDVEWYFLSGVDCLIDLDMWKNVDKILNACRFVVFNRPGFTKEQILQQKLRVEQKYRKDIIFLDLPLLDISATDIRNMIRVNRNVGYLLPQGIYHSVKELGLYL